MAKVIRQNRDNDGKFINDYAEVRDPVSGIVVRLVSTQSEGETYRTPFNDAHLDFSVRRSFHAPDSSGIETITYRIMAARMAAAESMQPCRKWPIPEAEQRAAKLTAEIALKSYVENDGRKPRNNIIIPVGEGPLPFH